MPLQQHSWISHTSKALALAGSMFVAENTVVADPPEKPDKPPITDEYRDEIIELLKKTRAGAEEDRLENLRTLEKALPETSEMMFKVRKEILSILVIQKLEESLYSEENPQAAEEAGQELVETWLKDDNYYVRRHAKAVLDKRFKDNIAADPRYRPPDISEYTNPLYEAKPTHSLQEWKESEEVQAFLVKLSQRTELLDHQSFETRTNATKEIAYILHELRKIINPLPQEILNAVTPQHSKTAWNKEWSSIEKRNRADRIREWLEEDSYSESALPPMSGYVEQVIADMESHFGMHIHMEPSEYTQEPIEITISPQRNTYRDILVQICEETGTYPVCDGHIRNIKLVPLAKAEAANVMVLSLDSAAAVFTQDLKDGTGKIELFMDPQLALIDIENVSAQNIPYRNAETTLSVLPEEKPNWNVEHGGWKPPRRTTPVTITEGNDSSITIDAWVAGNTYTQTLNLQNITSVRDKGPHEYNVMRHEKEDNSGWDAKLSLGIYEFLQWHQTPHESDTKTYAGAEATHVSFADKDGMPIAAQRGPLQIDKRRGTIVFTMEQEPHTATVTTYRHIMRKKLHIPLDGSGADITIEEEHFKLTGN